MNYSPQSGSNFRPLPGPLRPYLTKPGYGPEPLPGLPGPLPGPPSPVLPNPRPTPYDLKSHIPSEHVILSAEAQQLMGLGPVSSGGGGSSEKPKSGQKTTPTDPTTPGPGIWI